MLTNSTVNYRQLSDDYQRIEAALTYLDAHHREQPALSDVAASVGLSEYHFQRLFSRWVGISPKRYLQFVTKEYAKTLLEGRTPVLEAAYQSGLSSPGRLHDLFVACEAVTPGEYKQHGEGLTVRYAFHPSPFGECLLAVSDRGVCGLSFASLGNRAELLDDLHRRWRRAIIVEDPDGTAVWMERIFPLAGRDPGAAPLPLLLNGTNFQIKVWEALLQIPSGEVVTYGDLARSIGAPGASRAVGQAVGANPIAYIIPCHRVIRKLGVLGGYRWGTVRKRAILGWEMAGRESSLSQLFSESAQQEAVQ